MMIMKNPQPWIMGVMNDGECLFIYYMMIDEDEELWYDLLQRERERGKKRSTVQVLTAAVFFSWDCDHLCC